VSELLTKPKPWHMLSIKGREPFIRMHLWLSDPHKIEKLQLLKEERDSLKRKRDSSVVADNSNPDSPTDMYESYGSPGSAKKHRVYFSTRQKEALKIAFSMDAYPSPTVIDFLSQELNLETRSVVNWFHNHRMRLKQLHPHDVESLLPPKEDHQKASFDPLHFRILVNQRLLEVAEDLPGSPMAKSESGGLDLSASGHRSDMDEDSSLGKDNDEDDSAMNRGRSRRKPLAPQWVNPAVGNGEEAHHKDSGTADCKDE
jgi:homeobox protein cut-like